MIKSSLLLFTLTVQLSLFAQDKIFVMDSIMDAYMRSGYADKHFMGKGKYDKYDKQTGKWKDYEVNFENVFLIKKEGNPYIRVGMYLVYGKGEFLRGKREGEWELYVLEDKSFKKLHFKTVNYVNGKVEGQATYFFPNGKVAAKADYVNGEIDGEFVQYFENGDTWLVSNFSKSKVHGKRTMYYQSGAVRYEKNFVNDSLDGDVTYYYKNGKVQWTQEYKLGAEHGTYKYFHENGQVWTEKLYKDNLLVSVVGSYTETGEKLDHGTLENGNGTVKYYKHTGELYLIETFENGVKVSEERKGEFDW